MSFLQQAGVVAWPLLGCSVASLTLTLERAWFLLHHQRGRSNSQLETFFCEIGKSKTDQKWQDSTDDRVLLLGEAWESAIDLENELKLSFNESINQMRRGMIVFDTIITVSPLLGILGTVTGIISSFEMLKSADPVAVSGGIAQALLTTALGLGIAIITLLPYNYLRSRVIRQTREYEQLGTKLLILAKAGQN